MNYICHRINKIADLEQLDASYGCEIDLRSLVSEQNSLHLSHDPWSRGDDFIAWIQLYKRKGMAGPLILNTKEDGLEVEIIKILEQHQISSYFFLDTAFPTLVKMTLKAENPNFAIRISKFEDQSLAKKFKGKVHWLWLDCFNAEVPDLDWINEVKESFKICLVSPELQGAGRERIKDFKHFKNHIHSICTKYPDSWNQ